MEGRGSFFGTCPFSIEHPRNVFSLFSSSRIIGSAWLAYHPAGPLPPSRCACSHAFHTASVVLPPLGAPHRMHTAQLTLSLGRARRVVAGGPVAVALVQPPQYLLIETAVRGRCRRRTTRHVPIAPAPERRRWGASVSADPGACIWKALPTQSRIARCGQVTILPGELSSTRNACRWVGFSSPTYRYVANAGPGAVAPQLRRRLRLRRKWRRRRMRSCRFLYL